MWQWKNFLETTEGLTVGGVTGSAAADGSAASVASIYGSSTGSWVISAKLAVAVMVWRWWPVTMRNSEMLQQQFQNESDG